MDQQEDDCRALPSDTVDAIVATRLKTVQRALARAEADMAAELEKAKAKADTEAAAEAAQTRTKTEAQAGVSSTAGGSETNALSADQRAAMGDFIRRCWTYDAGAGVDQLQVRLQVLTDENGTARDAKVIGPDVERMKSDPNFRNFAERAVRAVLDPTCANLPLPSDMLGQKRTIYFRFSP